MDLDPVSWPLMERKWYRTIRPIIRVPRKMAREFSCWSVIIVDARLSGLDFDYESAEYAVVSGCFPSRQLLV